MTRVRLRLNMSYSLALLFFIITIALRNIRISISLCGKKTRNLIVRRKSVHRGYFSSSSEPGASRDPHALSPSRSRRSSRPRVPSPGARTNQEPFEPPGMRWSWKTTLDSTALGAICRSVVSGIKRRRVLWLSPFWQRWQASTTLRRRDSWILRSWTKLTSLRMREVCILSPPARRRFGGTCEL